MKNDSIAHSFLSHVSGPWVTADKSLKVLVGKSTKIKGPVHFSDIIARAPVSYEKKPTLPPWSSDAEAWQKKRESWGDYYRDAAVVAYPTDINTNKPIPSDKMIDLTMQMAGLSGMCLRTTGRLCGWAVRRSTALITLPRLRAQGSRLTAWTRRRRNWCSTIMSGGWPGRHAPRVTSLSRISIPIATKRAGRISPKTSLPSSR